MMKYVTVFAVLVLGGCVSQQTMDALNNTRNACAAGVHQACLDLPYVQAAANQEAMIIPTSLAILAAASPGRGPAYGATPPPRRVGGPGGMPGPTHAPPRGGPPPRGGHP